LLLLPWQQTTYADAGVVADKNNPAVSIVVLGDSISAGYGIQRSDGWVSLLEHRMLALNANSQVINASVSGETTSGGLARLTQLLETHEPDLVVIELGGNDGLRGYPVTRIRENLAAMVELCRINKISPIIFGMRIPPNYGPRYTTAFHTLFKEVADATNTPLVPFFLESVATESTLMQSDGIHPNSEAQETLLENAWNVLQSLL